MTVRYGKQILSILIVSVMATIFVWYTFGDKIGVKAPSTYCINGVKYQGTTVERNVLDYKFVVVPVFELTPHGLVVQQCTTTEKK